MGKKVSGKIGERISTTNPQDHIPYRNRWGHWVWRRADIPEDKNWPGLKPPSSTCVPEWKEDGWYWEETGLEKVKHYLKNNLKISITDHPADDYYSDSQWIDVKLMLEGETISQESFSIDKWPELT